MFVSPPDYAARHAKPVLGVGVWLIAIGLLIAIANADNLRGLMAGGVIGLFGGAAIVGSLAAWRRMPRITLDLANRVLRGVAADVIPFHAVRAVLLHKSEGPPSEKRKKSEGVPFALAVDAVAPKTDSADEGVQVPQRKSGMANRVSAVSVLLAPTCDLLPHGAEESGPFWRQMPTPAGLPTEWADSRVMGTTISDEATALRLAFWLSQRLNVPVVNDSFAPPQIILPPSPHSATTTRLIRLTNERKTLAGVFRLLPKSDRPAIASNGEQIRITGVTKDPSTPIVAGIMFWALFFVFFIVATDVVWAAGVLVVLVALGGLIGRAIWRYVNQWHAPLTIIGKTGVQQFAGNGRTHIASIPLDEILGTVKVVLAEAQSRHFVVIVGEQSEIELPLPSSEQCDLVRDVIENQVHRLRLERARSETADADATIR